MRRSLSIGGSFQCNGGKLEEAEDFKCVFVVYCVLELKYISSSAWIVGQLYEDKSLAECAWIWSPLQLTS